MSALGSAPAGVQAQAAGLPALDILGRDSVTAELNGRTVQQTVFIRNATPGAVVLRVRMPVQTNSGVVDSLTPHPARIEVPGGTVVAHRIEFDVPDRLVKQSFGGYLILADERAVLPPTMRWTAVAPKAKPAGKAAPLFGNVISLPFWLALATTVLAAVAIAFFGGNGSDGEQKSRFRWMMGAPKWAFAESWASTTTLATAFANAGLTALIADEIDKGLAGITGVFAVLVLIAPSLYNLSLRPVSEPEPGAEPRYQGLVGFYLLSSLVTLWGALGALYAGYILVTEISWDVLTGDRAIEWFQVLPWVIAAFVMIYGIATIFRTVVEQTDALHDIGIAPEPEPASVEVVTVADDAKGGTDLHFKVRTRTASAATAPARVRPAFPLL